MSVDLKEYFKLYLDPKYHDEYQHLTHADAKRYYRDYLTFVYATTLCSGLSVASLNGPLSVSNGYSVCQLRGAIPEQ